MNDKELMQQALEALTAYDGTNSASQRKRVLAALRERLAQPEQEPVAWISEGGDVSRSKRYMDEMGFKCNPLYTEPPKRELTCVCGAVWEGETMVHSPREREWVGLTDEEIDECERLATIRHQRHKYSARGQLITPADGLEWHFAGAIEAKLKEKNT